MSKARDLASGAPAPAGVTTTELGYVDGVSSAIQTQIDSKIGQSTAINPTIVDAKGDIIAATAADTVARLAVGSNDQVLTADSTTATGLKWATPAAGGMTLLSTTSMTSGQTFTVSSISQSYTNLYVEWSGMTWTTGSRYLEVYTNADNSIQSNAIYGANVNTATQTTFTNNTAALNSGGNNVIGLYINNYSNTSNFKTALYWSLTRNTANSGYNYSGGTGAINTSAGISSVTITPQNQATYTFTAGTCKVWGIK